MAVGKTFKPLAVTFKGSAILGVVSVAIQQQGQTTMQRADGAVSNTKAYREGLHYITTVTCEVNESVKDIADGSAGALVITYREQVAGANTGAEAATRTITLPTTGKGETVCTGVSETAGNNGNPQITIGFVTTANTGLPADLITYAQT